MTSFAELLRRHRVDVGLSQEALAEKSGLSTDAIGLLERGLRRHPQRHTVQALADGLGLAGADREHFLAAGRARAQPAGHVPAVAERYSNQLSPIIGREAEIDRASELLRGDLRLLTLTGPGGVGKTRLALVLSDRLAGDFQDGVVFVSLAAIRDPGLVLPTIAANMGVQEGTAATMQSGLAVALASREMLLVLDNFEQVLEAGPQLAAIMSSAPRLRVLVTSRAPLRLRGERELPIEPFPLPDEATAVDVEDNPAVRLFTERAQAVLPSFTLTPQVASAVAEVCRRLDGLPLAIELAAARAKILSPPALLDRLAGGTDLLSSGFRDAPERQRSLRATLVWSHDLLRAEERVLFRWLSVFSGGWTMDAAESICGDAAFPGADVLALLAALVDQSLVLVNEHGGADPRFNMLETIREFAQEQLEQADEVRHVRGGHVDYLLRLAERAQPRLQAREAAEWFAVLEQEHDNFRAALRWADSYPSSEQGLRLASALAKFWFICGHYAEGQQWIERFLAHPSEARASNGTRAQGLEGLAALVYNQGEYGRAAELFEQGAALYRQSSDDEGVARALTGLGGVLRDHGNRVRALAVLEESVALWRTLADQRGLADALVNLGSAVYMAGDLNRPDQSDQIGRLLMPDGVAVALGPSWSGR